MCGSPPMRFRLGPASTSHRARSRSACRLRKEGGDVHQMTFQRVCAWSGIACVTLFFVAFIVADFIPPLAPHMSSDQVAAFYQHHATRIRIGGCVMLLSGMFYAA